MKPDPPARAPLEEVLRQARLDGYQAESILLESNSYRIALTLPRTAVACPHCRNKSPRAHGTYVKVVADIPQFGQPVRLVVTVPRWHCTACARTFSAALPHVAARRAMTTRLVHWIAQEARARSNVKVAAAVGIAEGTVRNVLAGAARSNRTAP